MSARRWKPRRLTRKLETGSLPNRQRIGTAARGGDPKLDVLQAELSQGNLNVRIAESQFRQAQAVLAANRAALFPTVGGSAGAARSQIADPLTGLNREPVQLPEQRVGPFGALRLRPPPIQAPEIDYDPRTQYNVGLSSSWEIDLWGRVRRQV